MQRLLPASAFPDTYLAVGTEMALAERLALLAIVDSLLFSTPNARSPGSTVENVCPASSAR